MTSPEAPVQAMLMRMAMHSHPLTVSPKTCIKAAIGLMSQAQSSYVLIVEGANLTGIFTEGDVVRLIAADSLKEEASIDEVMTREPIALREDLAQDFLTILNIMGQHHIHHLPVVDGRGQLVGIITQTSILQAIAPAAIYRSELDRKSPAELAEGQGNEAEIRRLNLQLEQRVAERTASQEQEIRERQLEKKLRTTTPDKLQQELTECRQAEAALRESEARFRTMADSVPVLLWISGTDGLYTFLNQPWLEFTGRTLEQELGNGWTENVHREDFQSCLDIYLTSFHARRPFQMEYRLGRADGEYRWVLDKAIPRYNADGSFAGYIGSCIDITDRKQAEAERAKLIAIIEATPDFISSSSVDGQVLYFNKAARKILGLGEFEEIDNFQIFTGYPDWANDMIETKGIPTAMRDGSWIGETAILSRDGRELPLSQLIIAHEDTDGKVNMLSTIARDISQQKQIEAILRESARRWRSLLEHVRMVVVGIDLEGKVEYVNPFFLELVGYSEAEAKGCDWFATFLPKRDRPQGNKKFWEIIERDFQPYYQNRILTKSGEERTIAWNNTRLQDARGKAIGTMRIGEDITERYALERMKDELISVVSHELRTPLTAIHGGLHLLSSGLVEPQSDRGKRIIQISAENSDRLVQLVSDILELERLHSGKIKLSKQQVKATNLMNKATELMQVMANQAGVTISVSAQDIQLHADGDRIIQVLTNLLSNAIKFSPLGSTVWLTVQQQSEAGEWWCFHCLYHDDNDSVESHPYCLLPHCSQPILFQVKDRGCGIPANKLESIFERFGQVDASDSRQKGGTGLGLAICRSIIEQHGGQIWAESTLGKGSSFNFTLPGREENHDQQANSSD